MQYLSITSLVRKIVVLLLIFAALLIVAIVYFYYLFMVNARLLEGSARNEFQYIQQLVESKLYSNQSFLKQIFYTLEKKECFKACKATHHEQTQDDFLSNYVVLLDIRHNTIRRFNVEKNIKNASFSLISDIQNYYHNHFNISSVMQMIDNSNQHVADLYYEIPILKIIDVISSIVPDDIDFSLVKYDEEIIHSFGRAKNVVNKYSDTCDDFPIMSSPYALRLCKTKPIFVATSTVAIIAFAIIATLFMIFWILYFAYKNVCLSLIKISRLEKIDSSPFGIVEINNIAKLIDSYVEQVKCFKQNECSGNIKSLNSAKFEFLSCITHELRSPLNIIISFADLIGKHASREQHAEYINIISCNAKNLLFIVNNIIEVANIRLGISCLHRSSVDLAKLMVDVVESNMEFAREKNLGIEYNFQDDLPKVFVDSDKVHKALSNVISNAIKFNIFGGNIILHSYYNVANQMVVLSIKDYGIGMAESQMEDIFKDFNQLNAKLNRQFPGIGVGLFLAKKFIQMNDGVIKIFSKVGEGTEVVIGFCATK